MESFEPFTFLVALAWNSYSLATVTATPMMSKKIPTTMTKIKIKMADTKFRCDTPFADM